jgi:hypothetical protein
MRACCLLLSVTGTLLFFLEFLLHFSNLRLQLVDLILLLLAGSAGELGFSRQTSPLQIRFFQELLDALRR